MSITITSTKLAPGYLATVDIPVYPRKLAVIAPTVGEAIAAAYQKRAEFLSQPRFTAIKAAQSIFVKSVFPGIHKVGVRVS